MFNLKQWLRIMYTSAPWRKELLQELTNTETNKQTNHKNKQTNSCLGYALCTTAAVQQMHRQITFQFQMDPRSPTLLNNVASSLPLCCSAALLYTVEPCCLHYPTQCCWINILLVHGDWWIHTQWCTLKGHFTNQCLCRSSINSVLCSSIHASPDSAAL